MTTLDGNDLGEVQNEKVRKEAQLETFPIALTDSDETDVFDYGGVIKTITVDTLKTGTLSDLQSLKDAIEAILNGDQSITVPYVSEVHGTLYVKIRDVDYTFISGVPEQLRMTTHLVESSDRG